MILGGHLREDRFRDVVVPTPVGCAFGHRELVDEMSAEFALEPQRLVVHIRRTLDEVTATALTFDQRCLGG
ncbi:Uncharacterised protein [Mycobacteroides abscessus subsp. abscessus]|nr:Uncharacterised protein [Mycobacteroides abscessus subsp. abscessus]